MQGLPTAVYTTDADGRITFYNEAAAELWGVRPELGKSEFCGSWKLFWPDGTPLPHDECPMALSLKERRPIRGMEAIAERPDGTRVPFIPYPTPLFDAAGVLIGGVNTLVDITASTAIVSGTPILPPSRISPREMQLSSVHLWESMGATVPSTGVTLRPS